jgi:hypothetical protein
LGADSSFPFGSPVRVRDRQPPDSPLPAPRGTEAGALSLPAARIAPRRSRRDVAPDESRSLGVAAALALADGAVPAAGCLVYVPLVPVQVLPRGGWGMGQSWEVAGPLLRGDVLTAVNPLLTAGWRLAGSFTGAARWDMSVEEGPPVYHGCWVRMHREPE